MSHEQNILRLLMQQQRIIDVNEIQQKLRISQELRSLSELQKKHSSYLNHYDQLFRLMCIWLLVRDCDLTNHQPHQVLKAISQLQCPQCDVESMIQLRHQLKKGSTPTVNPVSADALQHCRNYFMKNLQAYISI